MANNNIPQITFDGADRWTPQGGRRNDLLSHNGYFKSEIASVEVEQSKSEAKNWQFVVRHVIRDEDNLGKTVYGYYPFTGLVARGKSEGQPNVLRVYDLLFSTGATKDQIAALKGKSLDPATFAAKLVGKLSFIYCVADEWEGRFSSKPSPLVASSGTAENRYLQAIATNSHRDPLPEVARAQLAGGTATKPASTSNGSMTAQAPAVPPTSATDLF